MIAILAGFVESVTAGVVLIIFFIAYQSSKTISSSR